jgi:hypothetical protein
MAEPDTTTAPVDNSALLQQLLQQTLAQPQAPTGARAQVARPSSITGLLGSALGGGPSGAVPVSADEADASGNRALLSFGLNLLANSGYRTDRPTIGQLIGGGIGAAQQSLGQSEALTAARGQAQQDYAQSQQEQKLARIKEAIPLLNLQQQLEMRKTLQGMPSPFASNTNIGAAGAVPPAPELATVTAPGGAKLSVAAAYAERFQGLVNDLEAAGYKLDPGTSGGYNPRMIAGTNTPSQHSSGAAVDLNWSSNARGSQGNIPPELARSLAAKHGLTWGGDWTGATRDPMHFEVPASARAGAKPAAPASPATATAAPIVPAPNASGGVGASIAPPSSSQFAGPGAPPDVTAPAPSPAATGNANAIMAGMVGAGADPTTLAPGGAPPAPPGSVPTQTAGLVVPPGVTPPPGVATAPTGPPPVTPDTVPPSFEEFQKQHPIVVPPEMQTLFNAKPDAEQLSVLQRQAKLAETAYNVAKATGNTAGMEKALGDYNTIMGQENTVRENAAKLGRDAQSAWVKDRIAQQHDEWAKMREVAEARETERLKAIRDQTNAQADAAQKQRDALALEAARGDEQRRTASAATENSYVLKQREQFAADHDATRGALGDYQTLRMFSDAAGKSTPIDNLQFGDKSGRDILAQWGFGTQAQREQWGAQQAFNAVINKSILAARQGVSMGQLSDRDMNFLQHMTVSQMQDPQTRSDIISYLEQTAYKKKAYMDRVEQLWDGGKGLTWGNARSAAEKEFEAPERDVVPRVPPDWKTLPPQLQQQFLEQNHVAHGSLVRLPNGKLGRYEVPQQ